MLGGARLQVTYTHEKSCFAYLNSKYSTNNEQGQSIQVMFKDKQLLLWAVYTSAVAEGRLACHPVLGRLLALPEGADVFAAPRGGLPELDELYVDADSPDDQEILENNAELLQLRLLDQLRVVVADQKCVVWISVSLPIIFTPKRTGLLVNRSRVVVKVDAFNSLRGLAPPAAHDAPKEKDKGLNNIGIINQGLLRPYLNPPKKLYLRAVPIDSDGKRNLIHPYIVFMHEDLLEAKYKDSTVILSTMKSIPSLIHDAKDDDEAPDNNKEINDLCVEIVPVDNTVFRSLCHEVYNRHIPTVLIPKSLNAVINIDNGMKIIFTIIGENVEQPEHIEITTYSERSQSETDVVEKFKNCVIDNTHSGKKFLINDGMVKQNVHISSGFLQFKLKPEKLKYTLLNSESFRHCSVSARCLSAADFDRPKASSSTLEYDSRNYCRSLKSMEDTVREVVSHLYFEIHRDATFKGVSGLKSNVLVTGPAGSGKSALCHIVQKELSVWSHVVPCRALRGRKELPEALRRAVRLCRARAPAVLLADDADCLLPPELDGASPADAAYYQRLAVAIRQLLQSCAGVSVLLTARGVQQLCPALRQWTFTAHARLPELRAEEKMELVRHLAGPALRERLALGAELARLAGAGGGSVRDLIDHLNRTIFEAVKKKKSRLGSQPRLTESAADSPEERGAFDVWGPVGGLHEAKRELTEGIFWPLMYPALFPSAACGILLYGAPGTGKSFVGSCLARLRGVELLVVKGPELLSRYIGQSEKAVRDVFDKADMKRPSILFFDEFDSLAPKRGHDSTGVTDRVVNQLLARLDGAEGGARVPVLAATARPDLIDPALLRPGRLARLVYCAPPDESSRYAVLSALGAEVALACDVDLRRLAAATRGFSPADLRALLVTAQLASLERQLLSGAGAERELRAVEVSAEDVRAALADTRPSLTPAQWRFYDTIYKKFRGEKLTAEQSQLAQQMEKQRVSLA